MLAIEVEFLMGRAILRRSGTQDKAEWPPHPQRLFSALAATHFDLDLGEQSVSALKWLENLGPPEIRADPTPSHRQAPSYWVPVNDEAIKANNGDVDFRHPLERRNRQERFFPAVVPDEPLVTYQWPLADGIDVHREALERLVSNLTYLGHSASPIRACLRTEAVVPTFRPSPDGEHRMRVPGKGRLERLRNIHALRLTDASVQPPLGFSEQYTSALAPPHTVFSPQAFVLAFDDGPRISLDSTIPLLQHFRSALLSQLRHPAPPSISGHEPDGRTTAEPHIAFVPLGFVDAPYANGSLKGIAIVPPRELEPHAKQLITRALAGMRQLHLGPLGCLSLRQVERPSQELRSLRFPLYTQPSRVWATVTPIVLDRHPKKKGPSPESIVSDSCTRVGLPAPQVVQLGTVSAITGSPRATDFHGDSKQTKGRLRCHAVLQFAEEIQGPLMLGAGRFIGLGLCLPLRSRAR